VRDAELKPRIAALHAANYGVYGIRKMHAALVRDGVSIGRDQTGRLMRELDLAGARRGKLKRTTIADPAAEQAADLVQRQFRADRPNRLWVCDLIYLRTWAGFAYLALVIDVYSRRIVGWALATHLRTDLPLEALELAVWDRRDRQRQALTGWSTTPTGAASTPRSATPTGYPPPALSPGRVDRRLLRQRPGRIDDRPDQDRTDPPTRSLADRRTAGVRPLRIPRLVEPPPSTRRDRHDHPSREGSGLLPSDPVSHRGRQPMNPASTEPRAVHAAAEAEFVSAASGRLIIFRRRRPSVDEDA
jgi:hypothetical protein